MAHIKLSIDGNLFKALNTDAKKLNYTVNDYLKTLITLGEKLINQNPFDYEAALKKLVKEAGRLPSNTYFTLVDLPSFCKISVARADQANLQPNLQPSIVRPRLGMMFHKRVVSGMVGNVSRAFDSSGNLMFDHRAAVYIRR